MIFPSIEDRRLLRDLEPSIVDTLAEDEAHLLDTWIENDFARYAHPFQWSVLSSTSRETAAICGRGAGKTRALAAWLQNAAEDGVSHMAAVSTTFQTLLRDVCNGPSGILANAPDYYRPKLIQSGFDPRLAWPKHPVTGVEPRCSLISASKAATIRGLEISRLACDEVSAWPKAPTVISNLRFALRGRDDAKVLWVSTPSPNPRTIADLVNPIGADGIRTKPDFLTLVTAATYVNREALGEDYISTLEKSYQRGTRIHNNEILGLISLDPENGLFTREVLTPLIVQENQIPRIMTMIVSVDPSRSYYADGDQCGAIIAGLGEDGRIWILGDGTISAPPVEWARHLSAIANRTRADFVVYERNRLSPQIVEMIERGATTPWFGNQTVGKKFQRLHPALGLVERDQLRFVETYTEAIVDELIEFQPDEPRGQRDNRVDAFSQAVNVLLDPEAFKARSIKK